MTKEEIRALLDQRLAEKVNEGADLRMFAYSVVDAVFDVVSEAVAAALSDQWCDGTKGHEPTRKWADTVTRCSICGRLATGPRYEGQK